LSSDSRISTSPGQSVGQRTGLARRVSILVGVPLIFQAVFVAVLLVLLLQQEQELERVEYAKKITLHANELNRTVVTLSAAVINNKLPSQKSFLQTYAELERHFDDLQVLLKNRGDILETVAEMRALMDRCRMYLEEARDYLILGQDKEADSFIKAMRQAGSELAVRMDNFSAEFRKIEASSPASQKRLRSILQGSVVVFLVSNALIIWCLLRNFNKSTITRLNQVIENTNRFGAGEPLLEVLPGMDEIARLDVVFHDMAKEVTNASKRRQDIMNMVAHDLRSPITSMNIAVDYALQRDREVKLDHADQRVFTSCLSSSARLISLINTFLDSEKLAAGKIEVVLESAPVALMLEDARIAVSGLCQSKQQTLSIADTDEEFFGDPERLTQVVVNFLSNASRYTPKGKTISVTVERVDPFVEISVLDEGPGIPKEKLSLLFQEFSQLDGAHQGTTGLGLFICKKLIEMQNGQIGADSSPQGSRFWFRVPRCGPPLEGTPVRFKPTDDSSAGG
jgi:signal transduction histidine kinase